MIGFWKRLPSIMRWILIFPLYGLLLIGLGMLVRVINVGWTESILFKLWFPAFIACMGLILISELAPSHGDRLMLGFIIIRALFIPALLTNIFLGTFSEVLVETIAEIIVLIASIYIYKEYRE
jgi:hypothetical protein